MIDKERLNEYHDEFNRIQELVEKNSPRYYTDIVNNMYPDLVLSLLAELGKCLEPIPTSATDKELVLRLNTLLSSASKKAWEWRDNEGKDKTYQEYQEYSNWYCYRPLWDEFWEIANTIKSEPRDYYNPDTTYEEDMRAMFNAYEWLLND
jgi:hypothetical protein